MNKTGNTHKRVLIIGQHNAGKTSIHSIIFASSSATMHISLTVDINKNTFKFLGNLNINLWDCGGSDSFFSQYFKKQQRGIFSNVEVLVFVCNAEIEHERFVQEMNDFQETVKNLSEFSPDASIFVLINKFDKVKDNEKQQVFDLKYREIMARSEGLNIKIRNVFQTSIWEETLYKAWSEITQSLIPNFQGIKESLRLFCQMCGCEEIVLFEKSTFLLIEFWINEEKGNQSFENANISKYERIANNLKQFQLSCQKKQANINQITIKSENFSIYIDEFTETTFIVLMYKDPSIYPAALAYNIALVRKIFENPFDFEKLKIFLEKN